MPLFRTSFTAPPDLVSVTATPVLAESAVQLSWTPTTLSDAEFWRYYVYRQDPDTGQWLRVGEVADKAAASFLDREAPHGATLNYAVAASNGWADSGMLEAATVLDLKYWVVVPDDPALSFELRHVTGYTVVDDVQQETFEPLGRSAPLVVDGQELAPSGTLTVFVVAQERERIAQLRAARAVEPYVLLKDPFGSVERVKLGSITRSARPAGHVELTVPYTAVA